MNALVPFRRDGVDVRVVVIDGAPWFVVADLARILGYRDAGNASRLLKDGHRGYSDVSTPSGVQRMLVTNEKGMYRLILRSNTPDAESVQDWITDEVLPAINATGGYTRAEVNALPQSYGEALRMLADEVESRAALEAKVVADEPKVSYVDEFVTDDDLVLFRVAASELGIAENDLRDCLIAHKWIYKTQIGMRWSRSRGREVREFEYRAASAHADKFRSMPQHNAPRHHNGQVRTTLYIRSAALPAIERRVKPKLTAVAS